MTNTIDVVAEDAATVRIVKAADTLFNNFYRPAYQIVSDPKNPIAVMFRESLYEVGK